MKGIAVVGASESNFWTKAALENIRAYHYPGPIWPVNPNRAEVDGLECYPSLRDLPGQAEVALVAVATERCPRIVADAVAVEIPHIVVISDGFAERGRKDLQDELLALVTGTSCNLYGPNCVGFIDIPIGLCAVGEPIPRNLRAGPVSFISQSGALLSAFMSAAVEDGIGLDWCLSLGNGAQVDIPRAVAMAVARPTTRVVCVYAEGLGADPSALGTVLDTARELGKWIVVLKVGASERASRIALSHTASLVGSDQLVSSFLTGHGAVRADSVEDLIRIASICSIVEGGPTGGVAIIGSSGGTAGMASDAALAYGLRLAQLTDETSKYLREVAPAGSFIENPFDITGRPGARVGMEDMWRRVFADPNVSFVVAPHTVVYPDESQSRKIHRDSINLYRRLAKECNKPTASVSLAVQTWTDWVQAIRDTPSESYVLVRGLATTIKALAKIFPAPPDASPDRAPTSQRASVQTRLWTEEEGRTRLEECGLPLVRGKSFPSPDSVDLGGFAFPVVVKIIAKGVSHKASLGGVRLGCVSEEATKRAAFEVVAAVRSAGISPGDIGGVRVEEMVFGPELLVGLQRDHGLGSHLTVGVGGTLTEAANETRTMLLPVTRTEIIEKLKELRLWSVFVNQRDALVDLVLNLSMMFVEGGLADLQTVELNPVIVSHSGPQIADVLIAV